MKKIAQAWASSSGYEKSEVKEVKVNPVINESWIQEVEEHRIQPGIFIEDNFSNLPSEPNLSDPIVQKIIMEEQRVVTEESKLIEDDIIFDDEEVSSFMTAEE